MRYKATIDLASPKQLVFDVTQDEVGDRDLEVFIVSNGTPWDYMDDLRSLGVAQFEPTVEGGVNYVKPDGTRGSYTTLPPNDRDAVIIPSNSSTGLYVVHLAPQVFTCAGKVRMNFWVAVHHGTLEDEVLVKMVSFPIILDVAPDAVPDGTPSTDYYNLHTLADIQQMVEDLEAEAVLSVNGQTPDEHGAVTVRSRDVPYTSTSPIYYDTPVENVMAAFTYMEEAVEDLMTSSSLLLYDNTEAPIPTTSSGMLTLSTDDLLGSPKAKAGDLIVDIFTGYIGELLSLGTGTSMLVKGTGKHFGG